uniref:RNA transcription, translation and transport factor protein n=1 Tax=Ciona savignyi TaxID=51511 RepID=H2YWJ4_CIOSA
MFRRKLSALGYPKCEDFNPSSEEEQKHLIIWLEDQKIRHYKVEDRKFLKTAKSWTPAFNKYVKDLQYPFSNKHQSMILDWILGLAVRLEYGDNPDKYKNAYEDKMAKERETKSISENPLENIKENTPEFKEGVQKIAKLLDISIHPDDKITLEAIKITVERLTAETDTQVKKTTNKPIPIDDLDLGFDTGDPKLNRAAKALRLLHINDLRQLQTQVNEAIVAVQAITANPKTDQRLGKIGR